jgi:prevent-host-death family protein
MSKRVVPIGEARRRLPELVRKVAGGHPPIAIGRRGRAEAVLSGAPAVAPARRPLVGLIELVGSWEDVELAHEEIREAIETGLEDTARLLAGPRKRKR